RYRPLLQFCGLIPYPVEAWSLYKRRDQFLVRIAMTRETAPPPPPPPQPDVPVKKGIEPPVRRLWCSFSRLKWATPAKHEPSATRRAACKRLLPSARIF